MLLITHPRGGKAFDYKDYWDDQDLIYTGRGKVGDQERTGPNRDVAENRRPLYAFEAVGPRRLRFLGRPTSVEERRGRAPGDDSEMRTVLQFRLRFPQGEGRPFATTPRVTDRGDGGRPSPRRAGRRPRPFDPNRPPAPAQFASEPLDPEERAALQEKARQAHHELVARLQERLLAANWTAVEEIPAAIDLWGRNPDGDRFIFEAKTLTETNETSQARGALAQLLEYRLEYGKPDADFLCVVVDREISLCNAPGCLTALT